MRPAPSQREVLPQTGGGACSFDCGGRQRAPAPGSFLWGAGAWVAAAQIQYQIGSEPWGSVDVHVVPSRFALFPDLPAGLATPARPGGAIRFFGSGLGNGTAVAASIGGLPAKVTYAGRKLS